MQSGGTMNDEQVLTFFKVEAESSYSERDINGNFQITEFRFKTLVLADCYAAAEKSFMEAMASKYLEYNNKHESFYGLGKILSIERLSYEDEVINDKKENKEN